MHSQNDDSLAQLVEHLPFKQRVPGSSPGRITGEPEGYNHCSSLFLWGNVQVIKYQFSSEGGTTVRARSTVHQSPRQVVLSQEIPLLILPLVGFNRNDSLRRLRRVTKIPVLPLSNSNLIKYAVF